MNYRPIFQKFCHFSSYSMFLDSMSQLPPYKLSFYNLLKNNQYLLHSFITISSQAVILFFSFSYHWDFKDKSVAVVSKQCIFLGNYDRVTTRNLATGFFKTCFWFLGEFFISSNCKLIKIPCYNQQGTKKCWWLISGIAHLSSQTCVLWVIEL